MGFQIKEECYNVEEKGHKERVEINWEKIIEINYISWLEEMATTPWYVLNTTHVCSEK